MIHDHLPRERRSRIAARTGQSKRDSPGGDRRNEQPSPLCAGSIEMRRGAARQYLGDSKVKNGEVRLVKICLPEVGQLVWSVGLQLSAALPCEVGEPLL